jgi:hypothetical protein
VGELDKTSEILRLLVTVTSSLRLRNLNLPVIASHIQDDLVKVLHLALISSVNVADANPSIEESVTERVIFLARLLQFDLGLRHIWTPTTCSLMSSLCAYLFRLVVVSLVFAIVYAWY